MRTCIGLVVGAGLLVVSLASCKRGDEVASSDTASATATGAPDAAVAAARADDDGDTLSAPPPPLAHRAQEADAWNNKLLADPLYAHLWTPAGKGDLDLTLTAIAEMLSSVGVDGNGGLPPAVLKALESRKLKTLFFEATATPLRTGALTPDFAQHVTSYLKSLHALPHYGVTAPAKGPFPAVAFAALAWWMTPTDRDYAREMLLERKTGPYKWPRAQNPWIPFLASPTEAYAKLSSITQLTDGEVDAYNAFLARTQPGVDGPSDRGGDGGDVKLATLLAAYSSNELRGDESYKGKTIITSGIATGIQHTAIGGISVGIGTGRAFESPKVLCSFDDDQADAVKAISTGDRIRVQGSVDGLMIDVILRHCQVLH